MDQSYRRDRDHIYRHVIRQIDQSDRLAAQLANRCQYKRSLYQDLIEAVDSFLRAKRHRQSQWIVMVGLRGVGKTTLMSQLYRSANLSGQTKLFLAVDQLHIMGASIGDLVNAIEGHIGGPILDLGRPCFLFLDEIHFLKDWSRHLKALYDQTSNLFIVCTGSSARQIQIGADSRRRLRLIKVEPLRLVEAASLAAEYGRNDRSNPLVDAGVDTTALEKLGQSIQAALFGARSAAEVVKGLDDSSRLARNQVGKIKPDLFFHYLLGNASLPQFFNNFFDPKKTAADTDDLIVASLNEIVMADLPAIGNFRYPTILEFWRLLWYLANADISSINKLSKDIKLQVATVNSMLAALIVAEIITPVFPTSINRSKRLGRALKYRFNTPALRRSIAGLGEADLDQDRDQTALIRGQMLEDVVILYLRQIMGGYAIPGRIQYDPQKGAADLVFLRTGSQRQAVVLEIGHNKTSASQVGLTLQSRGQYGLVITTGIDKHYLSREHNNVVFVPLRTFLLI